MHSLFEGNKWLIIQEAHCNQDLALFSGLQAINTTTAVLVLKNEEIYLKWEEWTYILITGTLVFKLIIQCKSNLNEKVDKYYSSHLRVVENLSKLLQNFFQSITRLLQFFPIRIFPIPITFLSLAFAFPLFKFHCFKANATLYGPLY